MFPRRGGAGRRAGGRVLRLILRRVLRRGNLARLTRLRRIRRRTRSRPGRGILGELERVGAVDACPERPDLVGEVTREKIELVRKATTIVEAELSYTGAFQYMAILHEDRVTGMRDGERDFGLQIEIRCWESIDARTATPTELPYDVLTRLAGRMTAEVPGVVSVTYNITTKPPSTMEVV